MTVDIESPTLDVRNIKRFPYTAIGTLLVKFPISDKDYFYTCFLIDANIVVTLASNLIDKNKGGKAISIKTTFINKNVKWENIYIQNDLKEINLNDKEKDFKSSLAVILYQDNLCNEWIGVEAGNKEEFAGRDINAVVSLGIIKDSTNNKIEKDEDNNKNKPYLREININNGNPFQKAVNSDKNSHKNNDKKKVIERCPGSPCYYKDFNSGAYVIAIINEFYEFQYFNKNDMRFLCKMVNLGRLLRNKFVNIEKIDLSGIKLSLNDIKYFISFDLNKLQILDLSSNSIGIQGALNFSKGQFSCLESLNLNYNYISDKGLEFICNGFFSKLNYLYLNKNNISFEGIKHLVKAEFTNNLIILSLDENKKIGDSGIRIIKEHKCWSKLNILYLNKTGLTDIALRYIGESSMPKLRKLNIAGNKFTDDGKPIINGLRMNHIRVNYKNIITIENNKEDDQFELGYYFIDGTHKQFE